MPSPILINTNCGLTAIEQVPCSQCGGVVYAAERIKCMGQVWHKSCFKCQVCRRALTLGSYIGHSNLPYCRVHYPKDRPNLNVPDSPEHSMLRHVEHTSMQHSHRHNDRQLHEEEMRAQKFSAMAEPMTNRTKMIKFVPHGIQDQTRGNSRPHSFQDQLSLPKTRTRAGYQVNGRQPGGDFDERCNHCAAPRVTNVPPRDIHSFRQPMPKMNQRDSHGTAPKNYGHGNSFRQSGHPVPQPRCCETYPKSPIDNHVSGKPGRNLMPCSCNSYQKGYRSDELPSGYKSGDSHPRSYNMCCGGGIIEDSGSESCSCQDSNCYHHQSYDRRPTKHSDYAERGTDTRNRREFPVGMTQRNGMRHSTHQKPPLRAEPFRANIRSHRGY